MDDPETHRPLLFSIAYRMLGTVADAEDIVQDVLSAYYQRDGDVEDPKAYLVKAVMNRAISRYQELQEERANYEGPWLPEPIPDEKEGALPGRKDELRLGWLRLLEQLGGKERAVLVLREAFDYDYEAIAAFIEGSEAQCRQILKRAKERLQNASPSSGIDPEHEEAYLKAFIDAVEKGDMEGLKELLHRDIVFVSDGGGQVPAALKPLQGRDTVMKFLKGILSQQSDLELTVRSFNGRPCLFATNNGAVNSVAAMELDANDEGIIAVHTVRNPEKLERF